MSERLVFDICMGDPTLLDVKDETFTPARPSTYLGLLVDFGWLDEMPDKIPQFKEESGDLLL